MKVLLVGQNSYVANNFFKSYNAKFQITFLDREYHSARLEQFLGFDVVINCAAIVHMKNIDNQIYYDINRDLVLYLARLAKEAQVGQFIQLSTIAVYGDSEYIDLDTKEDPKDVYGKSKLEADRALLNMQKENFIVSIIRPTIIYGKGAPGNMNTLSKLIATSLPLPLLYKENQRSILYIDNLSALISKLIESKSMGIFLARDKEMPSIYDIVFIIKKALKSNNIVFSMPKKIIGFLVNYKNLPFYKLYGNLIIDDSITIRDLGEYRKIAYKGALHKTYEDSQ